MRKGITVFLSIVVCLLSTANFANAGPFLDSGDSQLRSDLQILNDYSVINIPISSWPLTLSNVVEAIRSADESNAIHPRSQLALTRIKNKLYKQYRLNHITTSVGISGGNSLPIIRSFSSAPREEKQIHASAAWMDKVYSFNIELTGVDEPQDNKELRLDGSYVSRKWGNWLVSAGAQDRWWGPGWQGGLIMTNNARPVPGITLQRVESQAPETSWLQWVGPWSFMTFIGQMESERQIPNTKLWLARLAFKPTQNLEIGFSRSAQFGGEGRPESLKTILRMLLGQDNTGEGSITAENQPGNQLAGYDIRWKPSTDLPYAIYMERVGEDQSGIYPTANMYLFGLESWGTVYNADYRVYLEYADTHSYRGSSKGINTSYNHGVYESGYRYFGRSIGHSMDNDGQMLTLGGMLAQSPQVSWQASISLATFNSDGTGVANTVSPGTITDYRHINIGQNLQLKSHALSWGLGYEQTIQPQLNISDNEAYIYLDWSIEF